MLYRKTLTLAATICILAATAFADSQARIVRLSYVEGDVQLDRQDGRGFSHAFLNMPIVEGTKVWTRNDARAEIEFEDGSTVRLIPDTVLEFQQLRLSGRGDRDSMLSLQEGTAYFNIEKDKNDDFRVVFANEHVTFERKARFRISVGASDYRLAVFRGDIELLKSTGGRVMVRKNENLTVEFDDRDRYFLAKGAPSEPHDYWDREREDTRAEYANRQTYDGYSTAYSYGYRDLHRFGAFIHVDLGWVWRPHNVGFGWSPYDSGYWVYYPGQGYVFVSNYPWGWTPYRYGSWVHVNNRGWCWRPSNHHQTWVTVLNFNNAPHGWRPPSRPAAPTVVTASSNPRPYIPVGRAEDPDVLRNRGRGRVLADAPEGTEGRRIVPGGASGIAGGGSAGNTGGQVNGSVATERSTRPRDRVVTNETLPVDPNRRSDDAIEARGERVSRTGGSVQGQVSPVSKQRDIDDSSRHDEVRREEPVNVSPVPNPNVTTQTSGGVVSGRVERTRNVEVDTDRDRPIESVRSERSSRTPVIEQRQQPVIQQQRPVEVQRPVEQRVERSQRTYTPPPQPSVQQQPRPSSPPPQAPTVAPARSERVQQVQRNKDQ